MSTQQAQMERRVMERRNELRRISDRNELAYAEELADRYRDRLEEVVARHTREQEALRQDLERELARRKQAETELTHTLGLLHEALGRVKTLHRLLPVCGKCRKIRDDARYRQSVARYFAAQDAETALNLAMCPECAPELDRRMIRFAQVAGNGKNGNSGFRPVRWVHGDSNGTTA